MRFTDIGRSVLIALLVTSNGALSDDNTHPAKVNAKAIPDRNYRYAINGGEIFEESTGLTWARCSVGQQWKDEVGCVGSVQVFSRSEAQRQAHDEWRVPSKDELGTLVDCTRRGQNLVPTINESAFPDMDMKMLSYWTSTIGKYSPSTDYIDFRTGYAGSYGLRRDAFFAVRLVKGPQKSHYYCY